MPRSGTVAAAVSALLFAAALLLATDPLHAAPLAATTSIASTRTTKSPALECTITGTAGDDKLKGTDGSDIICGLGGSDTIEGLGGSDTIDGGGGDDTINGGRGNDTISGGLGSDTCDQGGGTGSISDCEWPNPLLICPVAHGIVYDDFGDPRGGHTHQADDITAKRGEPVLATFPGVTTNARAPGAGMYVTLTRADGSFTYGMHLSKFAKEGRYKTGDVIGYVGSTGNAGNTNHLHFEWHPGGGQAVDPFPYLSEVCPNTSG